MGQLLDVPTSAGHRSIDPITSAPSIVNMSQISSSWMVNALPHRARIVKICLRKSGFLIRSGLEPCPPPTSDLNPTEHSCDWM
jgi:transposase